MTSLPRSRRNCGAKVWSSGGRVGERIQRLQSSADFAIYTPGSNAGIPISLLKSFAAPDRPLRDDREAAARPHLRRRHCAAVSDGHRLRADEEPRAYPAVEHLRHVWKNGEDLTIEGADPCNPDILR